ncbi:MAG: tetratricopeptide repeat protein [Acidobacteria bacterium]|nr:tetratricopeptide repeat protein [Acidobacteriota bacterium]
MRFVLFSKLAICLLLIFHLPVLAIEQDEKALKDRKEQQEKREKEDKKKQEKVRKEDKAKEDKIQENTQDPVNNKAATTTERPTNPLATQIELAISLNQLIEPEGQNAWDIYKVFIKTYPADPAVKSVQTSLTTALGEAAKAPLAAYVQGANYIFTKNDWAKAQQYSKRVKELQPKNKDFALMDLFYQGMVLLADKEPTKAEEIFRQAIKKDDNAAFLYNALGRALSDQRKEEDSLKAYLKAATLAPDWTYPLVNIALKSLRKGDLDQAERYALAALNVNTTDVEAHSVLANVYTSKGNIEKAVEKYDFVITQKPNSIADQLAYGKLMLDIGNLLAAEKAFSTVLKLNPNENQARLYLAITAQKYSELILSDASKQLKDPKESSNAQTQIALADLAAHKNNPQIAIEAYKTALKIEPWQITTRFKLANLLAENNQAKEAIEEYRNITKANPLFKEVYINLGDLLKKNNDTKTAIVEYRKALAVDPNYLLAHINLAKSLQEIGELLAAAAEYRAILTIDANNAFALSALKEIEAKILQQQEQTKTPEESSSKNQ